MTERAPNRSTSVRQVPRPSQDHPVGSAAIEDAIRSRRAAVLNAAMSVFESQGLEDASIRMIAKAAGITTGAIYPYFKGKEEIYAELLANSLDKSRDVLLRSAATAANDEDRFRSVVTSFFEHYVANPNDLSLALYLFRGLKPQGLTPDLNRRLNKKAEIVLDVIKGSVEAIGGLSDSEADLEVGLQVSFLWGLLTLHHTKRSRLLRVDPRALLDVHIQNAVARLSAPRKPSKRKRR